MLPHLAVKKCLEFDDRILQTFLVNMLCDNCINFRCELRFIKNGLGKEILWSIIRTENSMMMMSRFPITFVLERNFCKISELLLLIWLEIRFSGELHQPL